MVVLTAVVTLAMLAAGSHVYAANSQTPFTIPTIPGVTPAKNPQQVATTVQILVLMTVLSVAPALLIMTTAFTRIVIVLSFLRSALGSQNIPPNQVMLGLALFLTFFVMNPTFVQMNKVALQPYLSGKMEFGHAIQAGERPLRRFMLKQTYPDDLRLFVDMNRPASQSNPTVYKTADDIPMQVVIPAFVISELKTGFIFGFIVYLPFVIIDLVVSSLLMSMGMMMLPPTVISLPAKILVFILADGWHAIALSLASSYKT